MNIDRTIEPDFKLIESIEYIKAQESYLDNGIPLYVINAGDHDVIKIDFIFDAGEWFQRSPLIAEYCINNLQEGTLNYSSEILADKLDFMGAFVYYNSSKHTSTISVYTLSKHLIYVLGYIEEIIKKPIFPENKFAIYNGKKLQQYIIESQKVEVISQQQFSKSLFGSSHPYGIHPTREAFENISVNDLIYFHRSFFKSSSCKIIASGHIDDLAIQTINKFFGSNNWDNKDIISIPEWKKNSSDTLKLHIPKDDAVQSAIRIGKLMVNKYHEDYPSLQLLNTVFGGYFGSRLMSNIREDKGYTYGIGSGIVSNKDAGYFVIVSQVGKKVCDLALKEIYYELDRIISEQIPDEELMLVKNYMMGSILRNFDGPFALSETLKTILEYGFGYEYYDNFIKSIKESTSNKLQALAISYFKDQPLYEIIAG